MEGCVRIKNGVQNDIITQQQAVNQNARMTAAA
jgi:hypothetical protein